VIPVPVNALEFYNVAKDVCRIEIVDKLVHPLNACALIVNAKALLTVLPI
jgi:hypothetical protein